MLKRHSDTHEPGAFDAISWGNAVGITYAQDDEPTIPVNTFAFWVDTDAGPLYYLIWNYGGTQVKVALA